MIDIKMKPRFDPLEAQAIVAELYELEVVASELPSERDQNFRLSGSKGDEYVLKIVNPTENLDLVEFESQVLSHLTSTYPEIPTPRIIRTTAGEGLPKVFDGRGVAHLVRLVSFLPGTPLAKIGKTPGSFNRDLGKLLAKLDLALIGPQHPSLDRDFAWSIYQAADVFRHHFAFLGSQEEQSIVEFFLARYEDHLAPRLLSLPNGLLHNDANDNNILVVEIEYKELVITGLLDFGDIVWGPIIYEPAIAAAYVMAYRRDPLTSAAEILAGYHEISPRCQLEIELYFDLICMRLTTSVVMAAYQRSLMPEHTYLSISEKHAWHTLRQLISLDPGAVTNQFMQVCRVYSS